MKVVLLHAFPLDERMWEPQREALGGVDVHAPRLYGAGRTVEDLADGVSREVPEGELVVVGASMGGYAALALARSAPERVRGLVLVGARPDPDTDERRKGRAETIELIRNEGAEGLWRALRPRLFPPEAPAEVVERARAITLEQDPDELVAAVEAMRDRPDASDVAQSFGDRLLVLVGSRDPFVAVEEAHAFGRGAAVAVFEGSGHLPNTERPEEFNHVLMDFLSRWR
jgi:3-oxoadipate enol-lactonase